MDKRLDVWIDEELKSYVSNKAKNGDKSMSQIISELIQKEMIREKGDIIEQQSLPVIREIIDTSLQKHLAQYRINVREDMQLEFTNEFKAITRASDNRLAALIVRALRDSSIARRLMYAMLSRSFGPDYALKAYEDAKERAGQELSPRKRGEEI
jgi:hypothetical protein